jgi:hypothetical protein
LNQTLSSVAALVASLWLLAACGSSSSDSTSNGGAAATNGCSPNITIQNVAFYGSSGNTTAKSVCAGLPQPTATIMNAPYALVPTTGAYSYGSSPYTWSTFIGESPGQAVPTVNLTTGTGALTIAGHVSATGTFPYVLAGLTGDNAANCVDASQYAGISFEFVGDLGGCTLEFFANDSEDTSTVYSPLATCSASTCNTPSYTLTAPGTTTIPFTAFAGGTPDATVDPASMISMHWLFTTP